MGIQSKRHHFLFATVSMALIGTDARTQAPAPAAAHPPAAVASDLDAIVAAASRRKENHQSVAVSAATETSDG
jgi:hypothetical protein